MEKSKELGEIIGIMLGDGNIYTGKNRKVHQIRIAGSKDEKEYLKEVQKLFEKVFSVKTYFKEHKSKNEIFVCCNNKDIVIKLIEMGLKSGDKIKNNIGIPDWIFEDIEFVKACIRGLIDTDGSLYPKTLNHPCASIWITSAIPKLREDIFKAFLILNYHPSKWVNKKSGWNPKSNVKQCCLGRAPEVIRYFKEIGFRNPKYIYSYYRFIRKPH
jgi:intein/homing endonuclease